MTITERESDLRSEVPDDGPLSEEDSSVGAEGETLESAGEEEVEDVEEAEDEASPANEESEAEESRDEGVAVGTERPRRTYDSIMDYVPSTTMGEVIRPTPAWRIPVVAIAAIALVGVGIVVALGMRSDAPVQDMIVQSTSPALVERLPGDTGTSSVTSSDEVTDGEILIIEDDGETGSQGADGGRKDRTTRPKRRRGRSRRQRPPPGATIVELDRLTVRRTIRSRMVHLHRCYDEALSKNPDLEGRLQIEITIGVQGKVTDAAIKRDSLRHDPTKRCILAKLKGWKFHIDGWLRRPVDVSFPVAFSG